VVKKRTYKELEQRVKELEREASERKKIDDELTIKNTAIESSINAIALADLDGNLTYINDSFLKMWGYSDEKEVLGHSALKFWQVEETASAVIDVLRDKGIWIGELVAIKKDGSLFDVQLSANMVTDKNDMPICMFGSFIEITQRKQAENALRESENKLKSVLSSMADLVFMLDKDGRFIFYHTPSPSELFLSPEEFMWKKHSQVMPPDIDKLFVNAFEENKKGGTAEYDYSLEMESRIRWFSVKLSPVLLDGKFNGSVAVVRDISARKQLEQSLRESEERYMTLFDNPNEAILITDIKTGVVLDANKQAEKLVGFPRNEIIGMHHEDLHPPRMAEYYKEKFHEHVEKGEVFDIEGDFIKKDGSTVPVIISSRVIKLEGKEVIQGLFKDISNDKMVLELKKEIRAKKLVEQAKGILMDRYKIGEKEAKKRLQKESRRQRKKILEIAKAVISSELILE
jgi:PAS domain S-box-containing protein